MNCRLEGRFVGQFLRGPPCIRKMTGQLGPQVVEYTCSQLRGKFIEEVDDLLVEGFRFLALLLKVSKGQRIRPVNRRSRVPAACWRSARRTETGSSGSRP